MFIPKTKSKLVYKHSSSFTNKLSSHFPSLVWIRKQFVFVQRELVFNYFIFEKMEVFVYFQKTIHGMKWLSVLGELVFGLSFAKTSLPLFCKENFPSMDFVEQHSLVET